MSRPLDGIRVLDLSIGPVAGMTTMMLADFGADVVHMEPPGGDPFRSLAHAPAFLRGKRSVTVNLEDEASRAAIREMASLADVFVTTLPRTRLQELELNYRPLSANNSGLVYCAVSGFGQSGPYANYPGYEGVVAAKSGRMKAFPDIADRKGPAYAAVQVGSHAASQAAFAGILAALYERETSGKGQLVETSMLRGMQPYDLAALLRTQLAARTPDLFVMDPTVVATLRMPTLNYHPVQTADGRWMQLGNLLQHLFDNYLMEIGLIDHYGDPAYEGAPATWPAEIREPFRERMLERMRERTADEWMESFVANGGIAGTTYRPAEAALDDPDLIENGHVHTEDVPGYGTVRTVGVIANLTQTPGKPGSPMAAAGSTAIDKVGWAARSAPIAHGSGDSTAAPLAGVTVLEFATIIAAPLGISMLGDLGARVIKVEPVGGDPYRAMGVLGIMAARTNQSKESIALDLKAPEAHEVIRRLVAKTDILIHNYRPGVPERLGIGYEECSGSQPRIVHLSVNGYGPNGPGAHRPSTHPIPGAALGGALLQVGKGRPPGFCDTIAEVRDAAERLMRANEANPDPNTSMVVCSAAMLGLMAAKRLGVGQQVFVDMLGANAYANVDGFIDYPGKPPRPAPDGELLGLSATYRLYQTGGDGWVFVALRTDREFAAFCELAGSSLAAEERFATVAARCDNDEALARELERVMCTKTSQEWEAACAPNGIGVVNADGPAPGDFWARDPHVHETGLAPKVEHPRYVEYQRWGPMVHMSRSQVTPRAATLAGQHTDAILAELGFGQGDVAELRAKGVAWSEAP